MRSLGRRTLAATCATALVVMGQTLLDSGAARAASSQLSWETIANSATVAPGTANAFNSFNQPSINQSGLVVFRARTAGSGSPVRGIYEASAAGGSPVVSAVAQVGDAVPDPNNSGGTFNEFPSFPRIGETGGAIVTRGQSTPVWTYTVDGASTKVGTTGLFSTTGAGGSLGTAASLLGAVPDQGAYAVPGTDVPAGTRFDQFPGAPSIDGTTVVFKGNYTVGTTGYTGVFYRDASGASNPTHLIANASTVIPGQPAGGTVTFGSTAPPSAANGNVVFTGWDNESTPTLGGVYLAPLQDAPTLTTLASIGEQVPGQSEGTTFTNFGEGLSYDGRFVAFWGSWGSAVETITLACPSDGNADLVAYCATTYPNGYVTTVPVNQGVFVYDTTTATLYPVAVSDQRFAGFLFWTFSGSPPGVGGSTDTTRELPRWRASSFAAVSGLGGGAFQVAFKASATNGNVGIFLAQQAPDSAPRVIVGVQTFDLGQTTDAAAPANSIISGVAIERDGFRGRYLAISVSMLDPATSTGWTGIYVAAVPTNLAMEPQVISNQAPSVGYVSDSVTLTASASSDLPVAYSLDATSGSDVCRLSGATLLFTGVGSCVVNATQAGDGVAYDAAAPVQMTIPVELHPQSISSSVSSLAYVGQTIDLTATADSGLPVTYVLDAATPTGVCTLTGSRLSLTGAGTCSLVASQGGDATYSPASPVALSIRVVVPYVAPTPASQPQVISTPTPPPVQVGGSYTLSATTSSGLPVSYQVDTTSSSVCRLEGSTLEFLSGGTCVVSLSQAGDGSYLPAPEVRELISVSTLGVTVILAPAARVVYGQPVVVTATVTSGSVPVDGLVQFAVDGRTVGAAQPVITGVATSPDLRGAVSASGRHVVTATFVPTDQARYSSAQATTAQTVVKASSRLAASVGRSQLRAIIRVVAPGAATPSGRLTVRVNGVVVAAVSVRSANLVVHYRAIPANSRVRVVIQYSGDARVAPSSLTRTVVVH